MLEAKCTKQCCSLASCVLTTWQTTWCRCNWKVLEKWKDELQPSCMLSPYRHKSWFQMSPSKLQHQMGTRVIKNTFKTTLSDSGHAPQERGVWKGNQLGRYELTCLSQLSPRNFALWHYSYLHTVTSRQKLHKCLFQDRKFFSLLTPMLKTSCRGSTQWSLYKPAWARGQATKENYTCFWLQMTFH